MACYLGIVLFLILATRVLAYWSIHFLTSGDITLIPEVLYFCYVENRGAAFGIFRDARVFLLVSAVLIFLVITYYVASRRKTLSKAWLVSLAMIAGGGISNAADRLQFGFVVDYIDFRIINYPVFNFADICVVLGVIWLAILILLPSKPDGE